MIIDSDLCRSRIAYAGGDRPQSSPTRLFLRDFASSGPGQLSWDREGRAPVWAAAASCLQSFCFSVSPGQQPGLTVTARLSCCYFSLKIKHDGIWAGRSRLGLKTSRRDNNYCRTDERMGYYQGLIAYIKYSKFKPDWNRILSRQVRETHVGKKCASVESAIRIRFCKHTKRANFNTMNHIYLRHVISTESRQFDVKYVSWVGAMKFSVESRNHFECHCIFVCFFAFIIQLISTRIVFLIFLHHWSQFYASHSFTFKQ